MTLSRFSHYDFSKEKRKGKNWPKTGKIKINRLHHHKFYLEIGPTIATCKPALKQQNKK